MKLLFDFFPILLFFGVFKLAELNEQAAFALVTTYMSGFIAGGTIKPDQAPIILSTVVVIAASLGQIIYTKLRGRKVDGMLWISFIVITSFGSATIYLHDDAFIKWKPTILYWIFALAMGIGELVFKKNMMRQVMEEQIKLPENIWRVVSLSWVAFFIGLGLLNLFVAFVVFKGNTSAWVSFKLFGINGILFGFFILQGLYLSRHVIEEERP
ncbi:MAG: septation protein A [Pseudomonadota bacterium]